MSNNKNSLYLEEQKRKQLPSWAKILIFTVEISFVIALLIICFSLGTIHRSKNLLVLFFYSFPAEFLIAIVPHEPILLFFGKIFPPVTVALVAAAGTVLTEILNYSCFKFIADLKFFKKIHHSKAVSKIIDLFNRAPFIALLIAGFTPIPFYPFRFLVVLARYPVAKYCLAVLLSRTPRFFILALLGHAIKIPNYLLIALFVALIIPMNISIIKNLRKKRKENKKSTF